MGRLVAVGPTAPLRIVAAAAAACLGGQSPFRPSAISAQSTGRQASKQAGGPMMVAERSVGRLVVGRRDVCVVAVVVGCYLLPWISGPLAVDYLAHIRTCVWGAIGRAHLAYPVFPLLPTCWSVVRRSTACLPATSSSSSNQGVGVRTYSNSL
eukprot:GHVU01141469.1.p2 GENE.GHVU01141469.1~~GHVU01141469.1.p2  ORF type:complete len:153 (-),score=12.02 GHVU01141469.1:145-603(-)